MHPTSMKTRGTRGSVLEYSGCVPWSNATRNRFPVPHIDRFMFPYLTPIGVM
jgi:hypothetical protein